MSTALRSAGKRPAVDLSDDLRGWLLGGDPAVRWQVQRDLFDAPAEIVAAQRARVAVEGWGRRLLSTQDSEGTWAGGLYNPKWTSTTYTLLLLRQLGLPADNPQAHAGCERLLDGARWIDGGLTYGRTVRVPETCITAIVVSLAAAFGIVDERVTAALTWLLDQQLPDGGWNCDTVRRGSMHGSFNTSILALEALREWHDAGHGDAATKRAAANGRAFFVEHKMFCSHQTGRPVSASFARMVFPTGWRHDVLRGLDYFQSVDAPVDVQLMAAVERVQRRRQPDGTWLTYRPDPGRYWFQLEPVGASSRINTLRALRTLRWWTAKER